MADFDSTFASLSNVLREHVAGMSIKTDIPGNFYIELLPASPKEKPKFFGAVQTKKSYVSYHLMQVYEDPLLLDGISDALRKKCRGNPASTSLRRTWPCSRNSMRLQRSVQRQQSDQRLHLTIRSSRDRLNSGVSTMKSGLARFGLGLALMSAFQVHACIPTDEDPKGDALKADAAFYGVLVSQQTLPGNGPMLETALTIKSSKALKGSAPGKIVLKPSCGDYHPKLNERVIVVRSGRQYRIHKSGNGYEQILLATLRSGR